MNVLVVVLTIIGLFFLLIAAMGFMRLPDVYSRLHVTGIIDTLGAPLLLAAAAIYTGWELTAGKLVLGLIFLLLSSPLMGHLLSKAALEASHPAREIPLPVSLSEASRQPLEEDASVRHDGGVT